MRKNSYGFAHFAVFVVLILAVVGFAAWRVLSTKDKSSESASSSSTGQTAESSVSWSFDGKTWKADGTPPECSNPIEIPSPVDISKVTSILYPGQYRGNDYKAHGGFRFEDGTNSDITVTVPLDAVLTHGSRYIEMGEVQYFFVFVSPCGIAYRFDHLLTLSDTFQAYADELPEAKADDSRSTVFSPSPSVKTGDTVATAVGFKDTGNTSVDFGVYDLRTTNKAYESDSWKAEHQNDYEYGAYGICWLNNLASNAKVTALALPAADGQSGKTSDYCE